MITTPITLALLLMIVTSMIRVLMNGENGSNIDKIMAMAMTLAPLMVVTGMVFISYVVFNFISALIG